ncbi:hypothetical protein HB852_06445 [Listeria grandensis]|uniref:YokE-like PH domain-containing protein n=2 Tax=Listeria grandensis TaxID=1494963 RepID=A0A7X1CQ36_9LIST|nr:hypothetical protein [Listeria grandensis]MBC1474250.1 hypothetical protein [Listeria grandensis]MBC1936624.1 hypothetical protein [Listeria grandensis]
MAMKDQIETEVNQYLADNGMSTSFQRLMYAGPSMRTRHSLVLVFTEVGLITFSFSIVSKSETQMYFLPKDKIRAIRLDKKRFVHKLAMEAENEEGQVERAQYFVSKRVFGRPWHTETLSYLFEKKIFSPL